jgi:hypothetical protein
MKTLLVAFVVGMAAWGAIGIESAAANGCGGNCGWYPYPYLYSPSFNSYFPSDRQIPYFSEFPPVYYSYPVARTYGLSPFAYPPTFTPFEESVPVTVTNPHVETKPTSSKKQRADRSVDAHRSPTPLVVVNPFVAMDESIASSGK